MAVLDATVKGASANSYITVAAADLVIDKRLYTTPWTGAATTPDAEGFTLSAGAAQDATSVSISGGTGTFTAGSWVQFEGDATIYTVASDLTGDGSLSFTPGLAGALSGSETVTRVTANDKERALMWATETLDAQMDWKGTKRTAEQALRWPRSGVYDQDRHQYDYDLIPDPVSEATSYLAMHLLEKDLLSPPAALGAGVSEIQAGSLKAKISSTEQENSIPDYVLEILEPVGSLKASAAKGTAIRDLYRT